MKITIIGTGYVGLVSGACLADLGNDVFCLDMDQAKIDLLNQGGIPIYEPGLEPIVSTNVRAGRLRFSSDIGASVQHGELQIIAVGTPPDEDGSADLRHVLAAARNVARHMTEYRVVVNKSTVPVGTADLVRAAIAAELDSRGQAVPFSVVSNPEFLKEGAAVEDFMKPDRIVIGADDERAIATLRNLYAPLQRSRERMLFMDVKSAELTKYAANAMLATRISFMNELANLAERLGANIEQVRAGIGSDPRIGYHFLYAGCGFGGSCFPKDVRALRHTAEQQGAPLRVLTAVEQVNAAQKSVLLEKLDRRLGPRLQGKRLALWGLAFKPDTNDLREAPSSTIVEGVLARGGSISAYDPVAMDEAERKFGHNPRISYAGTALSALDGADALIIVTEWKAFRSPDFAEVRRRLKQPLIFDGRNLYDVQVVRDAGLEYFSIGRA